jgi:hypothetical protein
MRQPLAAGNTRARLNTIIANECENECENEWRQYEWRQYEWLNGDYLQQASATLE